MPDITRDSRLPALPGVIALLLAVIALLGAWDLLTDPVQSLQGIHGLVDVSLVLVSGTAAGLLGRGWLAAERSLRSVQASLLTHQAEREAWRERAQGALRGLGEAIDRQFDSWSLTPAEKEVALLLLKGFSHKVVAGFSQRSERTVRQHAVSVYRKSGLGGRAELAAFFFEDMLPPMRSDAPTDRPQAPSDGR